MLEIGNTAGVLKDANVEATKASASIVAGNIIGNNIIKFVKPQLEKTGIAGTIAAKYIDQPLGKALLQNAVAGVLIHTMHDNDKAMLVANALISSANLELVQSFNIEEMFDNLTSGVNLELLSGDTEGQEK